MPSVGSCHNGLTAPEGCEQANEASRASLMLRAATQSAGALKDGLYARQGKQSSVADSARRCQREATSPNPSVRPSWRRLATQRRIEPSEFSILALSDPDRLTTATLEAVERRSTAVLSQKRSANPSIRCC